MTTSAFLVPLAAKTAFDVVPGDLVANLGHVVATNKIGVFVVAAVRDTAWSLATGCGSEVTRDVVWHQAQTVIVEVAP